MSLIAFTAFKAECDLCGRAPEGIDGTPWYESINQALDDLDGWGWHVVGSVRHVCCDGCYDLCLACDGVHGAHGIECDLICDSVDEWADALVEEGDR